MKRANILTVAFAALFLAVFASKAAAFNALNLNLIYSQKSMENWQDDFHDLPAYGIEADLRLGLLPTHLLIGASSGRDSGKTVAKGYSIAIDTNHTEMYVGLRQYMDMFPVFTPYASVAISTIKSEVSGSESGVSTSGSATATGYLLNAGLLMRVGVFNIGIDYRTLTGSSYDLLGGAMSANYNQAGIVLGVNF
ncbi:MAG: outer membrane beta-barrel protein [Nitrospinae bacterium]|nr:outer membrane beta-barrel protein [Nitrospinota bacterium]